MLSIVEIGHRSVGESCPAFIIAEIGINHNGDLNTAKRLIDAAVLAGCDAVKFQKRSPDRCVPVAQRNVMRETPWGLMSYIEYRKRIEFGMDDYAQIDTYCRERKIIWFASCWDSESVDMIDTFSPSCYKIASACLINDDLVRYTGSKGRPVILSTGMSTMKQIQHAVSILDREQLLLAHCTSTYPCPAEEINLGMIQTLKSIFGVPVGYSGHEVGLQISVAAVALGACFLERHITLDRTMWGSDHAASVEPHGVRRLVRDIRVVERAMGDGVKKVYDSELPVMRRLQGK